MVLNMAFSHTRSKFDFGIIPFHCQQRSTDSCDCRLFKKFITVIKVRSQLLKITGTNTSLSDNIRNFDKIDTIEFSESFASL